MRRLDPATNKLDEKIELGVYNMDHNQEIMDSIASHKQSKGEKSLVEPMELRREKAHSVEVLSGQVVEGTLAQDEKFTQGDELNLIKARKQIKRNDVNEEKSCVSKFIGGSGANEDKSSVSKL